MSSSTPSPPTASATPYADAVSWFARTRPLSLEVPGHGMRPEGLATGLAEFAGPLALTHDITRVLDGVDLGLDSPEVRAHRLAARAWGARRTWFLTNGASQANQIAVIAVRSLGARILAQRNAHSSLSDGMILAGLEPQFVEPRVDHVNGISHGVHPDTLSAGLSRAEAVGRPVSSVYLVSPSYFGTVADVRILAEVAHSHGVPLIVDCAWGPHFGFHPDLPETPVRLGADLVITSNHKLAGALGQSAMLHLGEGEFADRLEPLVDRAFAMTSSTSPSSLLLGSLDLSRHALETGTDLIGASIDAANALRAAIEADPHFALLDPTFAQFDENVAVDPLHIVIDISATRQDGLWMREYMMAAHGISFEMATETAVVAILGAGRTLDVDAVMAALDEAVETGTRLAAESPTARVDRPLPPPPGPLVMTPRDAFYAETELVGWQDSIGRIAAGALAAYPPGIPNVLPGERITAEVIDYLRAVAPIPGGYVRGAHDPLVDVVRVITDRPPLA